MSREGVVTPGSAAFQNLLAHVQERARRRWSFTCAAATTGWVRITWTSSTVPTISRMTLHCEYPAYMHRADRDIPVAGLMQVPRGTQITILAEANKPLVAVDIDDVTDENTPRRATSESAWPRTASRKTTLSVRVCRGSTPTRRCCSRCTMPTAFAAATRCGWRCRPIADEPPQVNVQLKGIGTAITPGARLPAAGDVTDDYGVARVWFDFHVDDAPAAATAFAAAADGREKLMVADALGSPADWNLQPKQKLHLAVRAADGIDARRRAQRRHQPALRARRGHARTTALDARSPRADLRRRFETIVEELTETRNSAGPRRGRAKRPCADAGEGRRAAARARRRARASFGTACRRRCKSSGWLQNGQRSAHETLQVGPGLRRHSRGDVNNRVDTEELKTRLKDGVADPLKRIVAEGFPRVGRRSSSNWLANWPTRAWPPRPSQAAVAQRGRNSGRDAARSLIK